MWPLFNLEEQYVRHPSIQREEIHKLLDWIKTQPHLPVVGEHEALLFFHACDHHLEYTKQVIDAHFTFRTHNKDFFGNLDMESPSLKVAQKTIASFVLETKTPEGCAVAIGKFIDTDPKNYDFFSELKLYCISQDKWLLEHNLVNGLIIIVDLTGFSFGHIARINLLQFKNFAYFLQETIPTRIRGIHCINPGSIIDKVMAIINPLLKKGLRETFIHVHSSLEELHKHIPCDILPEDFGGPGMSIKDSSEIYYQKLRDHRLDIIDYNTNHRVNEKLRPVEDKQASDRFGTVGNFKKLAID